MRIAESDKEHIALLLVTGNKPGAVQHIQDTYSLSAKEALAMTEKIEAQHVVSSGDSASSPWKVTGIVFTIAGFVLLSLGFIFGFLDYSFTMRALPLTGHVVSLEVSDSDGSTRMFTPVIEYTLAGHSMHMKTASSTTPSYLVGDEIELLVDPRRPLEPELNSFLGRWFVILLMAGIGLFLSVVGFGVRKMTTSSGNR